MSNFSIEIDNKPINNDVISLEESQIKPIIKFDRYPSDNYAVIMVDPDAPSPNNPIYRYFLHFLLINNNQIMMPYKSPEPPKNSGLHRYIFHLYKQQSAIPVNQIQLSDHRAKFDLDSFVKKYHLTKIDQIYFKTEKI